MPKNKSVSFLSTRAGKIAAGLAAATVVGGGLTYAAHKGRKMRREFERSEFIRKNTESKDAQKQRLYNEAVRQYAQRIKRTSPSVEEPVEPRMAISYTPKTSVSVQEIVDSDNEVYYN